MIDNETVPHPLDEVELMEDAIREARNRDDAKAELLRRAEEYMSDGFYRERYSDTCRDPGGQCTAAGDCYCNF
tara:strand:+ start:222 stop:440 length:219 start_codon:yes stop_codon:yes gene_type:complete